MRVQEIHRIDWGLEIVEGAIQKEINRPLRKFHFPNLSKEVWHSSQPLSCFCLYFRRAIIPNEPRSHYPTLSSNLLHRSPELESTVSSLRCRGSSQQPAARCQRGLSQIRNITPTFAPQTRHHQHSRGQPSQILSLKALLFALPQFEYTVLTIQPHITLPGLSRGSHHRYRNWRPKYLAAREVRYQSIDRPLTAVTSDAHSGSVLTPPTDPRSRIRFGVLVSSSRTIKRQNHPLRKEKTLLALTLNHSSSSINTLSNHSSERLCKKGPLIDNEPKLAKNLTLGLFFQYPVSDRGPPPERSQYFTILSTDRNIIAFSSQRRERLFRTVIGSPQSGD